MKKFGALLISTVVVFAGVVLFSILITNQLREYRATKEQIASELNFENRLMNALEWIPGNTIGEDKIKVWQDLELKSNVYYKNAMILSLWLTVWIVLYVVVNNLIYRKKAHKYQVYGMLMIFCSMAYLFLAVQSPFLEVMAYNKDLTFDVPVDINFDENALTSSFGWGEFNYNYEQVFEGRVYYLYQNKSVVELIKLLYLGGNFVVAILVVIMTLIFPIFKFISSIIILSSPHKKSSHRLYKVIKNLGKWSMIDVFTAAIFLAYFAFSNMRLGVDTSSSTLIGTYFFLIFVALSINSGQYLKKAMGQE